MPRNPRRSSGKHRQADRRIPGIPGQGDCPPNRNPGKITRERAVERRSRFVEKIHVLMQDGRGYPVRAVSDAEEQRGECEDIKGYKLSWLLPA